MPKIKARPIRICPFKLFHLLFQIFYATILSSWVQNRAEQDHNWKNLAKIESINILSLTKFKLIFMETLFNTYIPKNWRIVCFFSFWALPVPSQLFSSAKKYYKICCRLIYFTSFQSYVMAIFYHSQYINGFLWKVGFICINNKSELYIYFFFFRCVSSQLYLHQQKHSCRTWPFLLTSFQSFYVKAIIMACLSFVDVINRNWRGNEILSEITNMLGCIVLLFIVHRHEEFGHFKILMRTDNTKTPM